MSTILNKMQSSSSMQRSWLARLELEFQDREGCTVMARSRHVGPLRVQKPFYPESDGSCHVYILHPPGGMVMGDELYIDARFGHHARSLLTTPSAGKLYANSNPQFVQRQRVDLTLVSGSLLEWLPQETIVFNGAIGELNMHVNLLGSAKFFGWDMLRLGRVVGDQPFVTGRCTQTLHLSRDGRPLYIEKNRMRAGDEFVHSPYGLRGANTLATLLVTLDVSRVLQTQLIQGLQDLDKNYKHHWGLTQKPGLLVLRYLGPCILTCRAGFTFVWRELRPLFCNKPACIPRIWHT